MKDRFHAKEYELQYEIVERALPHLGQFAGRSAIAQRLADLKAGRHGSKHGDCAMLSNYAANMRETPESLRAYYAIKAVCASSVATALQFTAYAIAGSASPENDTNITVRLWGWNRFLQIVYQSDESYVGAKAKQIDLFSGDGPKKPSPQIDLFSAAPVKKSALKPDLVLYVGQTRSAKMMKLCDQSDVRELTQRMDMPARRTKNGYAIDNGCFIDWQKGTPFNIVEFDRKVLWRLFHIIEGLPGMKGVPMPDFVVMPDIVMGGLDSLEYSKNFYYTNWRHYGGDNGPKANPMTLIPWYFVVQNGMTPGNIDLSWCPAIKGIFVGGSVDWKFESSAGWVEYAHQRGLKCHIGRFTEAKRIAFAKEIGADSIDGNGPLWTEQDMLDTIALLRK